ncbi:MAG: hypothetical protein E7I20_05775 [Streptococcus sp.]|nr:hypothetical protein [Streptococcus sp.]
MEQVNITITVKSPTLIANSSTAGVLTSTRGSIDGRVLRGLFASQFISSHKLGREAHKNQDFMKLFYGDLRFVAAYKHTPKGTSFPAPLSLQKNKNAEGYASDDAVDFYTGKDLLGFKVEPNQVFVGSVVGPKAALEEFVRQFPKQLDCHIGRSRRTEYGHCLVEIGDITVVPTPVNIGNSVYVRLHTPLVLGNESISHVVAQAVQPIGSDISVGTVFASYQEEQSFNSIWGVRSSAEASASAGSIVELVKESGWSQDDLDKLQNILYNGMGTRLQEGYGQGRLWTPGEFKMVKLGKQEAPKLKSLHTPTQEIAKKVLEKQVIVNARLRAAHDVDTYIKRTMSRSGVSKHFASVLLTELGTNHETGHKQLQQFLEDKKAEGQKKNEPRVIEKNLREFHLEHAYTRSETKRVNLMEYIIDFDAPTLVAACLAKSGESGTYYEIPAELVDIVGLDKQKLSNVVAYEYWTYFFRHIRKIK